MDNVEVPLACAEAGQRERKNKQRGNCLTIPGELKKMGSLDVGSVINGILQTWRLLGVLLMKYARARPIVSEAAELSMRNQRTRDCRFLLDHGWTGNVQLGRSTKVVLGVFLVRY